MPAVLLSVAGLGAGGPSYGGDMSPRKTVRIGGEALVPDNPRSHFARVVNDAPVSGETVALNPPRFRWRYFPTDQVRKDVLEFRFRVAKTSDFRRPVVDVLTPYNFYNTLQPLEGNGPFYWRVGYVEPGKAKPSRWSPTRAFRIAPDARVWDRSVLARPDFAKKPHPRIILSDAGRKAIRRLVRRDAACQGVLDHIRKGADAVLRTGWYRDFPASDAEPAAERFVTIAHGLCCVAFMRRLSGEAKYASVVERAATFAAYSKGGRSSPEPMGESHEDSTQVTELLALCYDWLWPELSAEQRSVFVGSLSWRIDHFVNNFAWKRGSKRLVYANGSLSTETRSHQFEGFWDTFPAALACYEESAAARECFDLGVNWLVGVSCGHGFDEGWNEGPGYSNSKFRWITHSMVYLDSVFPEFKLSRHPWLERIGEWFCRVTPVGLKHAPWGHNSNNETYYRGNRVATFWALAHLTGRGVFLRNWSESGGKVSATIRPWVDLSAAAGHKRPRPALERDPVGFFPLAGWVMAGTKPPSSRECYEKSVGMIFQCRPAGAYSHSFCAENSFHIFGYGEDLTHAAGTSSPEPYSGHSMSHNTILVDGIGQTQRHWRDAPRLGLIRAFARGRNYLYWAGDATAAYPRKPTRPHGYWGRFDDYYLTHDAAHLRRFVRHVVFLRGKYFVVFDDLAAAKPAKFTWLYHVLPARPFRFDKGAWTFDYQVGKVGVRVVHAAGLDDLELIDTQKAGALTNPITGEDYANNRGRRGRRGDDLLAEHNLFISNKTPAKALSFLAVIAPVRPGEKPPIILRLDDRTVQVGQDVVSFDPDTKRQASIIVDAPALRADPPMPEWYKGDSSTRRAGVKPRSVLDDR